MIARNDHRHSALLTLCLSLVFSAANTFAAPGAPAKKTVCTITINSRDEIDLFRQYLDPKRFAFVELTEAGLPTSQNREDHWFSKACASGVQCDLLVISGHFGGTFIGSSGYTLELNQIEKHACAQDCRGILSNPAEVFLFGCNTLSTKDPDTRTPEQYARALVEHDWDPADAILIAEARYGILGEENRERMKKAFSGAGMLYGFSSIAPSGPHIRSDLERYLRSEGDYEAHLNSSRAKKTASGSYKNETLAQNLRSTSFTQTASSPTCTGDCELFDEKIPRASRLAKFEAILKREDRLKYTGKIYDFFRNTVIYPKTPLTAKENSTFKRIAGNTLAAERFAFAKKQIRSLPMGLMLNRIQHYVGWIDAKEFSAFQTEQLNQALRSPVSLLTKDTLCGLFAGGNAEPILEESLKLNETLFKDTYALQTLSCLPLDSRKFVEFILNGISKSDKIGLPQKQALLDNIVYYRLQTEEFQDLANDYRRELQKMRTRSPSKALEAKIKFALENL